MKVAIIGASGFVGSVLLNEALSRGHQVTAIVRNPEKITVENPNLTIKQGDASDSDALATLLEGNEAVLSTFNAGWTNPNLYDDFLAGSKAIQEGTKKAGIKRLLVVGGAGSLEVAPNLQLVDTPQFPAEWKAGATAARDYLTFLREEKDLDWTFLSPAIMLEPGERTANFRLGGDQLLTDEKGDSKISVQDLSVALVDELEKNQFIQKRFTVAY
ncbi:NAD(P)-dependent oxidoreductase [Emticicia sp. SJ17W-69]|uniref:NAD(P)-dependent oxidoreductase n=1 Tax=Emticicia sp. SJ17W-69 TaxID=3421657 RepID=UPI003EBB02FA